MIKKSLFTVLRLLVFVISTCTAAVLVLAALGVLFTMLEWYAQSRVLATAGVVAAEGLVVGLIAWRRRRKAVPAPTGPKFWLVSAAVLVMATAGAWGVWLFHVTPPLTVQCLRPLGAAAVPALLTSLDSSEASPDNREILAKYPEALLGELPRLEARVRDDRHGATELIAGLGPPAHAAAPTRF